ncbi:hypothetical protein F3Y22_tig00111503pilonHSYRG00064 [Hibiscus syriacus]|uniref:Uncharacterized protein n=1 Tax=Hibiscus syriacus TaxID=106335 RepID=A0A6A2XQA9_HIBSY|nr:hypothetical protein F3Y22_tig00111503pilonHSYRG00064 [Hibiscus syriacus]
MVDQQGPWPRLVTFIALGRGACLSVFPTPTKTNCFDIDFRIKILMSLDISYNSIQGELSGIGLGNLSELLTKLGVLIPQNKEISMEIPVDIGNLVNITTLDLSMNCSSGRNPIVDMLSGEIPKLLFGLKELKKLHLEGNRLALEQQSHNRTEV